MVIGSQWGDEGKGKIIDVLAKEADFVVRTHGGNNAGHTVINEFGKFPMHLVPSGIFANEAKACITNGVVLDLDVLVEEIEMLAKSGFYLKERLFISPRCHIIMPYHKILDKLYEDIKGKAKTGTTGRGIGPTYADKVSYNGIRLFDLGDKKHFREKLETQLLLKNKIIKALSINEKLFPYKKHMGVKNKIINTFGTEELDVKLIENQYLDLYKKIKPFIKETYILLADAIKNNKKILIEGAHGVFLDNDWGTYPYVTASTVLPGGINAASGISNSHLQKIVGVVKAYMTRVGTGPFPTELLDKTGEILRESGGEYGTTTGRPRRCGWIDGEMLRASTALNNFTDLAITKLDVLDKFEEIKICTGYKLNNKKISYFEIDARNMEKVQPIYIKMFGWKQSTRGIKKLENLPKRARVYLEKLEEIGGAKVSYISTGPSREEIIVV